MVFEERPFALPAPGQRNFFSLRVAEEPNGAPVLLPVMAVRGRRDGPTVLATGCLHGNEILSSDVVRQVALGLDPEAMSGTFLGLPMVNPSAVSTRTRANVVERYPGPLDMNRVFPGNPGGVLSQRIAHLLLEEFVARSDLVIDLHNASVGGRWVPYAISPPAAECPSPGVHERTDALARAVGFDIVLEESIQGAFCAAAVASCVPATLLEFGVADAIDPEDRALGIRAVDNALRFAGVLPGAPVACEGQVRVATLHRLTAARGGYLEHLVEFGSWVAEGEELARVSDLAGRVVERFQAPCPGIVCRRSTLGIVGTGDLVVYVGARREDE